MKENRWLTIHFTDGTNMRFDFPVQSNEPTNIATKIKKSLGENHLSIEVEGVLHVFPYSNIAYFRVYPCPETLPDFVIKGGKLID